MSSDKRLETAAKTAFVSPTALASQRLGSRLSPRPLSPSDTDSTQSNRSRRSTSLITGPDEAEIFDQMLAANSVRAGAKLKNRVKARTPVESPVDDLLKTAEGTVNSVSCSNSPATHATNSSGKSTLDFKNNDNSFHVLGSLLVEFFQGKIDEGESFLQLKFDDRQHVERLLPGTARSSFVEAVGYRLERTPSVPTTPVQFLTLQCQELGLDETDATTNPILAVMEFSSSGQRTKVPYKSLLETSSFHSAGSLKRRSASKQVMAKQAPPSSVSYVTPQPQAPRVRSPPQPELRVSPPPQPQAPRVPSPPQPQAPRVPTPQQVQAPRVPTPQQVQAPRVPTPQQDQAPPQHYVAGPPAYIPFTVPQTVDPPAYTALQTEPAGMRGGTRSISPLDSPSIGNGMGTQTNENMARQQLLAELNEASNFMAESVNPETTQFWKNQVLQLQARLRALHGESSAPNQQTANQSAQLLENNRRLVTEHQQREQQYVPPTVIAPIPRSTQPSPPPPAAQATSPAQTQETEYLDDNSYEAPSMVDVVAPADLPGGYHFEAEIEGQRFLATVPSGGVKLGETFTCPWRELDSVAVDVPVGYWKDGWADVFSLGFCHPVICNAIFAPLILLGQIQTRIKLDFLGRPPLGAPTPSRLMMVSVMGFWFCMNLLMFGAYNLKWYRRMELSVADVAAFALVNFAMYGFVVFVVQSTRSTLRERFMIRETRCYDLEDICCATWCLPCTVSQMARHTANYDAYEAVCCSKTGLPYGVRVNQQAPRSDAQYVV